MPSPWLHLVGINNEPSIWVKGHSVVQTVSSLMSIGLVMAGGGIEGWWYMLLHMISVVVVTGMLVKRQSTSTESKVPVECIIWTICRNMLVELIYLDGRYLVIIVLHCLESM